MTRLTLPKQNISLQSTIPLLTQTTYQQLRPFQEQNLQFNLTPFNINGLIKQTWKNFSQTKISNEVIVNKYAQNNIKADSA